MPQAQDKAPAVYSMTGYAKVSRTIQDMNLELEMRSVNNRFLEVQMRLPRNLHSLETPLRNQIRGSLARGSVQCTISLSGGEKLPVPCGYQDSVVQGYLKVCEKIQQDHPEIKGDITLDRILEIPDLVQYEHADSNEELLAGELSSMMDEALTAMKDMRAKEGENLAEDMHQRLAVLDSSLSKVENLLPERIQKVKTRLQERIQLLMQDQELDEVRLIQEVSMLADRLDVSEEITRFRSHNQVFADALRNPGPHGKKLNFILQEMGREANTLATKSQEPEIAHLAVACKEEVETLREQVQNLE